MSSPISLSASRPSLRESRSPTTVCARRRWEKLDKKAEEQYTSGTKNVCSSKGYQRMGQATRTTKLLLDLGKRNEGGANRQKRAALDATAAVLTAARAFYIDFLLAHADKLSERVI